MRTKVAERVAAFAEQSEALADRLAGLSEDEFAAPSVLDGWDVRTLVGHLALIHGGLVDQLPGPGEGPATALAEVYARRRAAAGLSDDAARRDAAERNRALVAEHAPADPVRALRDSAALFAATDGLDDRAVLGTGRSQTTALDWVNSRLVELVVHCDDLSRSWPDRDPVPLRRGALAAAVRVLAEALAAQVPGHSVEVRVPPFVAVQAVEGPRHTRGTPPNVVETDPVTWLRLAAGRTAFGTEVASGAVRASGLRADLTEYLPVLA